jgi:hypothetical protein
VSLRIAVHLDGVLANPKSERLPQAARIENFWESLSEIEPDAVSHLAKMAESRQWEVIFLTSRTPTAGATAQVQSQRWLESKGFPLASVYDAQGSRGRIADALGLDIVIDDRPDNCVDVVVNSEARAILVWRGDEKTVPEDARRRDIRIVKSATECVDLLATVNAEVQKPGLVARIRRMLGLKEAALQQTS